MGRVRAPREPNENEIRCSGRRGATSLPKTQSARHYRAPYHRDADAAERRPYPRHRATNNLLRFFSLVLCFFLGFGLRAENGLSEETAVVKFSDVTFVD